MARPTKMIIITSNEDIIRKFSMNKNTHIIDFNDAKKIPSSEINDKNTINLAFLTQLSELNSNNDQVYKRAIDSPQDNPSKPGKTSKKSRDIICAICGDEAIGFNYDVLSCASCKAFFRRNANQPREKIRCLTGRNQCSIAHEVPRKCPKCRLERCFAAGMRKNFILSEEEKQRRITLLEENRNQTSQRLSTHESINTLPLMQSASNSESLVTTTDEIDRLLMDVDKINGDLIFQEDTEFNGIEDPLFGTLSIEDWLTIQTVQSSLVSFFHLPMEQFSKQIDFSTRVSALITWSEFDNRIALRFIDFFRQINELQGLLLDDRLILIKYNLPHVFPICKCYNFKYTGDCSSLDSNEEVEKHRRFFMLLDAPNTIRDTFKDVVLSLLEITGQDPTLLSLLLIILTLAPGLSMSEEEPPLNDPLGVNRAQCHYIKILWNYLVNQLGEIEACRRFTQLLTVILRLQSRNKIVRLFFRDQFVKANTVDKLAPLMQSVLNIS